MARNDGARLCNGCYTCCYNDLRKLAVHQLRSNVTTLDFEVVVSQLMALPRGCKYNYTCGPERYFPSAPKVQRKASLPRIGSMILSGFRTDSVYRAIDALDVALWQCAVCVLKR